MIKLVFFGSDSFPVPILKTLLDSKKVEVLALVTSPNVDKSDRLYRISKNSNIMILQPEKLTTTVTSNLKELNPDLFLVCNYGKILPSKLLEIPKYASLNIHCSLLPILRGACPIEMAILKGFKKTGITIQIMEETMDTGEIIYQKEVLISKSDTGHSLAKKMQEQICGDLVSVLDDFIHERLTRKKQNHNKATYCYREDISKKAAKIKWSNSALEIERVIRAFNPRPKAWTYIQTSTGKKRLRILSAGVLRKTISKIPATTQLSDDLLLIQTGKYVLTPKTVQLEGRSEMEIEEFIRGFRGYVTILP